MITITCPHCGFSREVPGDKLPPRPAKATCPRCREVFRWAQEEPPAYPFPGKAGATVICPHCQRQQLAADLCSRCGEELGQEPLAAMTFAESREKAGFWLRVVAALIDSVAVSALQFTLGWLLGFFADAFLGGPHLRHLQVVTLALFNFALWQTYKVFFTGYCGQTPGKMAMRIKVVRVDGSEVGFGRAFLREVLGKFLSTILFGFGFVMVAFDRNKQGLHDRLAATYVIQL